MEEGLGLFEDFSPSIRKSINYGYITLPIDARREDAIVQAYRTERVSILVEKGAYIHNCYITRTALREIEFPAEGEEIGSAIVFLTDPRGKAFVFDVLSKAGDSNFFEEKVYTIKKTDNDSYAVVSIDGKGQVNIDVIGTSDRPASLNINVRDSSNKSTLNIQTKGSINIYSESGDINIKAQDANVVMDADKISHGTGKEAMLLGDTTQKELKKTNDVLDAVVDALSRWSVAPSDGGAALQLYFKARLGSRKVGDFNKIKSEQSFLD